MSGGAGALDLYGAPYPQWREAIGLGAIAFVLIAAFPKLAYRLRWPTRLGPRVLGAYIAFNTAVGFALRTWAAPYLRRMAAERERATAELRQALGREPTADEVMDHLGFTCKR